LSNKLLLQIRKVLDAEIGYQDVLAKTLAGSYIRGMREQGDECDEEFTARIQADRIGCLLFEGLGAIVECLDEFEHCAGCWIDKILDVVCDEDPPSEFSISSVRARIAASGVEICALQMGNVL